MISYIKKLLRQSKIRKKAAREKQEQVSNPKETISSSLNKNLDELKKLFGDSGDFIIRQFLICGKRKAAVCYVDGLTKAEIINDTILKPLMIEIRLVEEVKPLKFTCMDDITQSFLLVAETEKECDLAKAAAACLNGDTVLLVDSISEALIMSSKGWEKRAITEPQTDTVIRGSREGFTESLRTNTALIRRRIKIPDLRMEQMVMGTRTRTQVCLAYIDKLANPELIKEIKQRLETIHTDAVLNSGYIEEFIEDNPLSLFETIGYTERPDIVAGKLLEGRAAIIIDGTPFALTMPMLFIENFQTSEDYAVRPAFTLVLRLIRFLSFFLSLMLPAIYIALVTFHQELIPTQLLFTIAVSSYGLPFPAAIEITVMLVAFEIIKEAGVRLPKPIGQAIGILGALVMGQAAIQAGIVGAPVVIVVALTAITGFVSPSISDATAILRWYLLILAATMGGFGITLGMITLLIHLGSIKSFGSDYLAPFTPLHGSDLIEDTLFRAPHWGMRTRPDAVKPLDRVRQNTYKPDFDNDEMKQGGRK